MFKNFTWEQFGQFMWWIFHPKQLLDLQYRYDNQQDTIKNLLQARSDDHRDSNFHIDSLKKTLDLCDQENKDFIERISALETIKNKLLSENGRLASELSRVYADKAQAILFKQSAEEQLRDERDGIHVLQATNQSLERRLGTIMTDLFDLGDGMYMTLVGTVAGRTQVSKSFRIPLKLQKKIVAILTPKQKKTLKTKS